MNATGTMGNNPARTSTKGAPSETVSGAAVALGVAPAVGYAALGVLAFML
jgi:hypothetical protein